jgi:hypothetical protein
VVRWEFDTRADAVPTLPSIGLHVRYFRIVCFIS